MTLTIENATTKYLIISSVLLISAWAYERVHPNIHEK